MDVEAYPPARHTWFFNGKHIRTTHKYIIIEEERRITLKVVNAQPEDGGEYTIKLDNEYGDVSCTTTLIIQRKHNCNFINALFICIMLSISL